MNGGTLFTADTFLWGLGAICQLNLDALALLGERDILDRVLDEMERDRDRLWPGPPP